jgi:hypothetical protein
MCDPSEVVIKSPMTRDWDEKAATTEIVFA